MKLFLSSGEVSSDRHAAELIRALRKELQAQGEILEVFGVGGEHCQAVGMELWLDQRKLKAMGLTEILIHLPRIVWNLQKVVRKLVRSEAELAVVLDYPGFHFALIRRAFAKGFRAPWVYFIPPKVWVWRSHRVEFLRKYVRQVLCIFPFEKSWFAERGLEVQYVGNPLLDQIPRNVSKQDARSRLEIPEHAAVAVVLPGSRNSELKRHLRPMVWAVTQRALSRQDGMWLCIPAATEEDAGRVRAAIAELSLPALLHVRVSVGDSISVMQAADWGLIKSGTSTLEASVVGLPHALGYQVSPLSGWLFKRWIRYSGPVGLPNLVLGRVEIPELILENFTRENWEQEAAKLEHPEEQKRQKVLFEEILKALAVDASPSVQAARALLRLRSRP